MKICKYCKKPIPDNDVWNPDSEGNGYHHVCLIEIEFRSRDRQIYDKGRADVLDKIRTEIENIDTSYYSSVNGVDMTECADDIKHGLLELVDKYKGNKER